MRDDLSGPFDDELICLALLYASGELDEADAAAFEQRLAEDQTARDALCQAVEMNVGASGQAPLPDPAYRQSVRQRLQQRRRHLRKMAERAPGSVGHPALWCALGAAAAVILLVVLHQLTTFPGDPKPSTQSTQETPLTQQRADLERKLKDTEEKANALIAALAAGGTADERRKQENELRELARGMVDLDQQMLKVKARQLERDLSDVNGELTRMETERSQLVQKRFEGLLEKVKKLKS